MLSSTVLFCAAWHVSAVQSSESIDSSIGARPDEKRSTATNLSVDGGYRRIVVSESTATPQSTTYRIADSGAQRQYEQLEEIVVTAQRREQPLQDVPIAISAFTGHDLQDRGVENIDDLQFVVPGLENVGSQGLLTLRGVGTENATVGGDPGVSVYLDGHYQSRWILVSDLLDTQRVEAQRGPQGTLYGRNATGGNLSIISNRPTPEFEGSVGLDVGNYDERRLEGVISGPFSERIRGRLAIAREKRDGYVKNTAGSDAPNSDYTVARGLLDIDMTDSLLVSVGAFYSDDKSVLTLRQFRTDPSPKVISQDGPNDRDDTTKGGSIDFFWKIGGMEFRSLSAFSDEDYFFNTDFDATPAPIGLVDFRGGISTVSQEFQLVSPSDAAFRWVTGLYYYKERSDFRFQIDASPGLFIQAGPAKVHARSVAAFGQAEYSFNDQWEMVAGVRETHDYKDITRESLLLVAGGVVQVPSSVEPKRDNSWDVMTWKAGLNYHFSPDLMWYASLSRGYKMGGYNASATNTPAYGPEFVKSLESGFKTEWLNRTLQVNLTAFHYDYTDKQETVTVSVAEGSNYIVNAAGVKVYGVELESVVQPVRGLRLNLAAGYLHGEYDKFKTFDATGVLVDLSGNTTTVSPKFKYALGGEYTVELGANGSLTARMDYSHTDKRFYDYFNLYAHPAYERLNALLRWDWRNNLSGELYCRNLKDDRTYFLSDGPTGEIGYLPPRTYGLRVRYEY